MNVKIARSLHNPYADLSDIPCAILAYKQCIMVVMINKIRCISIIKTGCVVMQQMRHLIKKGFALLTALASMIAQRDHTRPR